jgi:hypothetical protein
MYRVLVTGSRNWKDPYVISVRLNGILLRHEPFLLIHGQNKRGADKIADDWARAARAGGARVFIRPMPASWEHRGSGFDRNQEMVDFGASVCLAFVARCVKRNCPQQGKHGSHGATDCAGRAREAGIPTYIFEK